MMLLMIIVRVIVVFIADDYEAVIIAMEVWTAVKAAVLVVEDERRWTWRHRRRVSIGGRHSVGRCVGMGRLWYRREFDAYCVTVNLADERVAGRRAFGRF